MRKYKITFLNGTFAGQFCPPEIVPAIFPDFAGWPTTVTESYCEVTVPEGIEPLNLSPLIKIEIV